MTELSAALVSITRTQRGRFFWAAWWSAAPLAHPFRRPDASNGGAASHGEAMAEAERVAQRALVEIEPRWARACVRLMRGMAPFSPAELREVSPVSGAGPGAPARPRIPREPAAKSLWAVLGVEPGASVEEIKRAFRKRALETHPDQGGDAAAFRALHAAYERALARRARGRPAKRR